MSPKIDTDDALRTGGVAAARAAFTETPEHTTADEREAVQRWLATIEQGASTLKPTGAALAYERALMARILNQPQALDDVAPIIRLKHLADDRHRQLYETMTGLDSGGRVIDDTALVERLERATDGTAADWFNLINALRTQETRAPSRQLALSVFEAWRNRQLAAVCAAAYSRAKVAAVGDGDAVLSDLSDELAALELPTDAGVQEMGLGDAMAHVRDDVEQRQKDGGRLPGIASGWSRLDWYLQGLAPGRMHVAKAKTGFGKSAWGLSLALKVAQRAALRPADADVGSVLVVSLEMDCHTMGLRMLANASSVDATRLSLARLDNTGTAHGASDVERVQKTVRDSLSLNDTCRLLYRPGLSIGALERHVRRVSRRLAAAGAPPLKLLIVDYLQLLTAPHVKGGSRELEVAAISEGILRICADYGLCGIALSQMNADGAARESRKIEQDAHSIIRLEPTDPDAEEEDASKVYDMVLEKNRHGSTARKGQWRMLFMRRLQRFVEIKESNSDAPSPSDKQNGWWYAASDTSPGGSHD